ncbi:TrkH family potassium uptake protein [Sneathiella chinensis]|uniref:Trk system potassium uptake protein n=2 Tax=Alphaproteobacteria TaxID=28211 RepID=A0ABQ5U1X4_9PROT|nr:TrkH family potassium uptake protein [Sneathiella chinensis]GLQ05352.1 Trk system potassium uptake protein [Sneathiella chinensis]
MINFRLISAITGMLLTVLGLAMLIPAAVDLYFGHQDWQVFLAAAVVAIFIGGGLFLSNRESQMEFSVRQAFLLTTVSWVMIPAFAALPLTFSELDISYTDAYFEAMSGLTTTGSTVLTGLDFAPPGILLWRALLQWLGGIGIIVMAIAILPLLRVGGMQLFRMEGAEASSEKALPRVAEIVKSIGSIYLILSIICTICYYLAGMSFFEAVAHAMTTISTAGFSTSDGSMGHFDNALIDAVAVVFMILGGLPFLLYMRLTQGQPGSLANDSQVRWFLVILVFGIFLMTAWQLATAEVSLVMAVRYAAFNVTSVITGTGYATTDYNAWGGFAVAVFFFLMFVGGCAGSTSCGIKIFRFQVVFESLSCQLKQLIQPNGIFQPQYNGRPLGRDTITAVMSFMFLFMATFALLTVALSLTGLDFLTAISSAGTAIANVGPGLGDIVGPSGSFKSLPDSAKWLMSLGMLLGRLELFTVLVLFTKRFWQR